jgi:hypothetical protein
LLLLLLLLLFICIFFILIFFLFIFVFWLRFEDANSCASAHAGGWDHAHLSVARLALSWNSLLLSRAPSASPSPHSSPFCQHGVSNCHAATAGLSACFRHADLRMLAFAC